MKLTLISTASLLAVILTAVSLVQPLPSNKTETPTEDTRVHLSNHTPAELLKVAYKVAQIDGHSNPAIVQQVLLQESLAGAAKNYQVVGTGPNTSFGLLQLKIVAARDVLSQYPSLVKKYELYRISDTDLGYLLAWNSVFNIEVGSKYLMILTRNYGYTGRELLNAYNRGPTGVKQIDNDSFFYAIQAEEKLERYRRLNNI